MPLRPHLRSLFRLTIGVALAFVLGCDSPMPSDGGPDPVQWEVVTDEEPGALLSVWGTSSTDLWVVGADARDGSGPIVLHIVDGVSERVPTGLTEGDLWWVFGFGDGPIFMGGSRGVILRYDDDGFTTLTTPDTRTVYGIWGSAPDAMWAVGGNDLGSGGFVWRLEGDTWNPEASVPADIENTGAVWKLHGRSADDIWFVGSAGIALHFDGTTLSREDTGVGTSLFTVFGTADRFVAVGGEVSEIIVEHDGDGWVNVTPEERNPFLTGVVLDDAGGGVAVGAYGLIMERTASGWVKASVDIPTSEDLHGVWIDDEGGVWAAGGHTLSRPLSDGVLLYRPPE